MLMAGVCVVGEKDEVISFPGNDKKKKPISHFSSFKLKNEPLYNPFDKDMHPPHQ